MFASFRWLWGALTAAGFVALGASAEAASPDLTLELELLTEPFPMVHVQIETAGGRSGSTRLTLADQWGGNTDFQNEIRNLSVTGENGRLTVTNEPGHVWTVKHAPGERLHVSYYLASTIHEVTSSSDTYYRPIIRKDLVHFIGHTALAVPEHLAGTKKRSIRLKWKGFASRGWTVASSFSVDQKQTEVTETLEDFVHSVFVAAPNLELVSRRAVGGHIYLAMVGDHWGFDARQLATLATRIIRTERKFFGGHHPPFYLVSLIPVGQHRPGSASIGGTGLTHSFALFMTPEVSLEDEEGLRIRYLLAHEHLHHYIGGIIQPAEPEELVYWFTEGFTDFYTRRVLLRSGLSSLDEYTRDLNEKLRGLYLSPVGHEPNVRIQQGFWESPDLHKLPYQRGDLVALVLDARIRAHSKNEKSLDDAIRALLNRSARTHESVSTEQLITLFAEYLPEGGNQELTRWITQGELPPVRLKTLLPCLKGEMENIGHFDLGFDFDSSRPIRRVQGVRKGSAAWRAGLRDGQELRGWSVTYGAVDKPVELTIRDGIGTEEEIIRYLPQVDPIKIPQFERAPDGNNCDDVL